MLVSQLQSEISASDLSLYRIAREADVDLAQLSKFKRHGVGLSLASAGRICEVLALRLTSDDGGGDDAKAQDTTHGAMGSDTEPQLDS